MKPLGWFGFNGEDSTSQKMHPRLEFRHFSLQICPFTDVHLEAVRLFTLPQKNRERDRSACTESSHLLKSATEKGIASEQLFTIHADICRPSIFDIFVIGSSHLSPGTACLFSAD